jgi:hypothetical protein
VSRSAGQLADGLFTEINMIIKLLTEFRISRESPRIYLREDRDAERELRKETA